MLLTKHILDNRNKSSEVSNLNESVFRLRKNYAELSEKYDKLEAENKELREQISTLMATINMLEKSLDDCRNK
jgi:hypothetical protein